MSRSKKDGVRGAAHKHYLCGTWLHEKMKMKCNELGKPLGWPEPCQSRALKRYIKKKTSRARRTMCKRVLLEDLERAEIDYNGKEITDDRNVGQDTCILDSSFEDIPCLLAYYEWAKS